MIRVLVVDDDFMVADVHRRLVQRQPGFEVVGVAHTAANAVTLLREQRPDLLILDVYLPDRSGVEVFTALRSTGIDCEVIVISAARDPHTVAAMMRMGALRYFVKPFDPAALSAQLVQVQELFEAADAMLNSPTLSQDSIDAVFAIRHPVPAILPKGLSPTTLDLVVSSLDATEPRSALDISATTGISRASARRYLEHLVEVGKAELTMRYGATGRPEHRYRLLG